MHFLPFSIRTIRYRFSHFFLVVFDPLKKNGLLSALLSAQLCHFVFLPFPSFSSSSQQISSATLSSGEEIGIAIVGTIVNQEETNNVVLIKNTKTNKVMAFRQGQALDNRYLIEKINEKSIILKNRKRQQIFVYQDKFSGEYLDTSLPFHQTPQTSYAEPRNGLKVSENTIIMTDQFRRHLLENEIEEIIFDATAIPNYQNGNLNGFRLIQITPDSLFHQVGFANNDLITGINGNPLNSLSGALTLIENLTKKKNVVLEYNRGGRPQKKTLMIK